MTDLPNGERPDATQLHARNLTRENELAGPVELADSFAARFRGLMGRTSLAQGSGLWLTGTSNIHMFFMRFSIDAVFLGRPAADGTRRVVAVHANLRPWTGIVWYARGADGCLELSAGTAEATGTRRGDVVILERVA
jgi:uncharacterized membrane protein (UPF0127 family)